MGRTDRAEPLRRRTRAMVQIDMNTPQKATSRPPGQYPSVRYPSLEKRQHKQWTRTDMPLTNQPPMLLDTTRKRNLLAHLRARRRRQLDLRQIRLHAQHPPTRRRRADVDQQQLVLHQLRHLRLLLVLCLHTQQPAQQEQADLELRVDLRQLAHRAEHLADEAIRAAERRVDARADTDEATGHGEVEQVVLGVQGHDAAEDGLAAVAARSVLGDYAWPDLDLLPEVEDAGEDGAASNATLEVVNLRAGLVDVEGTDDDQSWVGREVAHGDGDPLHDVLVYGVDVVLQLRGNRYDG